MVEDFVRAKNGVYDEVLACSESNGNSCAGTYIFNAGSRLMIDALLTEQQRRHIRGQGPMTVNDARRLLGFPPLDDSEG
jgi:hypothetical protein